MTITVVGAGRKWPLRVRRKSPEKDIGSWCKQGIRYQTRQEYEVIEELKGKYPITFLCQLMGVNKSGYYKWKNRQGTLNRYEKDRVLLTSLLEQEHRKHPSHGYHRLANDVYFAPCRKWELLQIMQKLRH